MRALLLLLTACAGSEPVQLLDNGAWSSLDATDPLAGEACSDIAASLEGSALEIETEGCSPVALGQRLAVPIEAGDALEVVWWHDWLFAEEPTTGRLALYVDGALLYEGIEDIPGPPAAYTEAFEAPVGGDTLVVRIENHGANTWDLLRLTRTR
ncbi:MAG: hypothetical protein H6737_00365 [Alphaproteobacteria bacterium]|nr:hypothetical protein [Alphaproteobacteria bacterium]